MIVAKTHSEAAYSPFSRYALNLQGFGDLSDAERRAIEWPLRFTPAACATLVIVGTVLQWPVWQFSVAAVALLGALFAKGSPVDAAFNSGVRHLLKTEMLPANPPPRRFACFVASLMLTGSGLAFLFELSPVGFVLGGALAAVLALNAFSNWCLGAWMYRLLRLPA